MHRSRRRRLRRRRHVAARSGDRDKRPLVAGLLGQAFVVAYNTIAPEPRRHRRTSPTSWSRKGELYGDEVVELLDGGDLRKPEIDVLDEATWPAI